MNIFFTFNLMIIHSFSYFDCEYWWILRQDTRGYRFIKFIKSDDNKIDSKRVC